MVVVVLAGHVVWQPRQDHLGLRQAHEADRFVQRRAVVPRFERAQDILAGSIWPVEKPDVHDSEIGAGPASFDLTLRAQRGGLLVPYGVSSAVAASPIDHRDAFVLVVNGLGQISADHRLVVRMRHDHQNVGFEALIRPGARRRLRNLRVVGGWLTAGGRG